MSVIREFLLDRASWDAGEARLVDPPDQARIAGADRPTDAEGWASLFGAMVSYEAALDEAGYETEAQMRERDAVIQVRAGEISDDGVVIFGDISVSPEDLVSGPIVDLDTVDVDPLDWMSGSDDDLDAAAGRATDAALSAVGLNRDENYGTAQIIEEQIGSLLFNIQAARNEQEVEP